MPLENLPSVFYINSKKPSASNELSYLLKDCFRQVTRPFKEIVFLCIGSDRITGDSLGPLIGHQLSKYDWKDIYVYGTLDAPVHALNLEEIILKIKKRHPLALIVAIDASLGSKKHLGFITIGNGSICPGSGVNKILPGVGDIFITGIINVSGTFEHFLLQTTRLSTIVNMADSITKGILYAMDTVYDNLRILPDFDTSLDTKLEAALSGDNGTAALSIDASSEISP
jgi:putative sporulation protein YyaC